MKRDPEKWSSGFSQIARQLNKLDCQPRHNIQEQGAQQRRRTGGQL
jgi:hypothetical protein